MPGFGTIVDAVCIIIGGLIGLIIGKRFSSRFQETLLIACGLSILFIGVSGTISQMLVFTDDGFSTAGSVLLVASLTLGGLIGEGLDIERHMTDFGEWLKKKTGSDNDNCFVNGFVSASLVVSIGTMAVLGPINEGLYGDSSVLYAKSVLDLILVLLMTLSHGKGCIFSFIPVVVIQALVTILAGAIRPIMTAEAIASLTMVGSVLIASLGINMVFDRHIRVSNLFPSVIIAIIWAFVGA